MRQTINFKQYWKRNCKQFTNIFSVKLCGFTSALFFIGGWLVDSTVLFFLGSLIFISIPASILMIYSFAKAFSEIRFYMEDQTVFFNVYCDKAFEKPFKFFTSIKEYPNFLVLAEVVERITYENEKHIYERLIGRLEEKMANLSATQVFLVRVCFVLNYIASLIAAEYIFTRYAYNMSTCIVEINKEVPTE